MLYQSYFSCDMFKISSKLVIYLYTQVLGRLDCNKITAERKYIPYIQAISRTSVSVDSIFNLLLLKLKSKKFLILIENDRTLEIMRYPINPNDIYWEYVLNVSFISSFRNHVTKFKNLVMGSVLNFLPLIIFQAVRKNLDIEQIVSTNENNLNNFPIKVSEIICFLYSSTIYR